MKILGIDPGTDKSAIVGLDTETGHVYSACTCPNEEVLKILATPKSYRDSGFVLAIEMVASYGMPVGREVFETCVWIGRFIQQWGLGYTFIYRKDEKMTLCGSMKAKDANIRQALIDLFGPGKEKAVGTKKRPGPLYGIHGDEWAALAVAVTYAARVVLGDVIVTGYARCSASGSL